MKREILPVPRTFVWKKEADYGRRGPVFYSSSEVQVGYPFQKEFVACDIQARVNGPNTAMATFYKMVRWPTDANRHFGHAIYRHFQGRDAGRQARAWCNFLLHNWPNGVLEVNIPPRLRQEVKVG